MKFESQINTVFKENLVLNNIGTDSNGKSVLEKIAQISLVKTEPTKENLSGLKIVTTPISHEIIRVDAKDLCKVSLSFVSSEDVEAERIRLAATAMNMSRCAIDRCSHSDFFSRDLEVVRCEWFSDAINKIEKELVKHDSVPAMVILQDFTIDFNDVFELEKANSRFLKEKDSYFYEDLHELSYEFGLCKHYEVGERLFCIVLNIGGNGGDYGVSDAYVKIGSIEDSVTQKKVVSKKVIDCIDTELQAKYETAMAKLKSAENELIALNEKIEVLSEVASKALSDNELLLQDADRKELLELRKASERLDFLDAAGVDNWEGIEHADELQEEYEAELLKKAIDNN